MSEKNVDNTKGFIKFENVVFGYTSKLQTIKNISFDIFENEYICIIGHNGSGKSTISKLMTGLLNPQSGKIKILGQEINNINIRNIRNNIGIIFQNPDNQFVGLTVEDDIAFGLENHKIPAPKMKKIIETVSAAVGIKHLLHLPPSSLSGGQKQRVAIASVLAVNPKIIIFDESTSMLDPNAKEDLKDLMLDLKTKYGKTIISVTHDMEEVTKCDRVIIMDGGKVLKIGTPNEIFSDREFLIEHSLDVPFNLHLCLELDKNFKKSGKKVEFSLDKDEIIKSICKLEK